MDQFKVSEHEWKCSACGKESVWSDEWEYYGAMVCKTCGREPCIEFVTCSEPCRKKWANEL